MWFRGQLSIAILAGGIYLLSRWYDDSHVVERTPVPVATDKVRADELAPGEVRRPASTTVTVPVRRIFRFDPDWNSPTLELSAALALLVWATCGRLVGHQSALLARCGPNEGGQREGGGQEKPEAEGPASEVGRPCAGCSRGR